MFYQQPRHRLTELAFVLVIVTLLTHEVSAASSIDAESIQPDAVVGEELPDVVLLSDSAKSTAATNAKAGWSFFGGFTAWGKTCHTQGGFTAGFFSVEEANQLVQAPKERKAGADAKAKLEVFLDLASNQEDGLSVGYRRRSSSYLFRRRSSSYLFRRRSSSSQKRKDYEAKAKAKANTEAEEKKKAVKKGSAAKAKAAVKKMTSWMHNGAASIAKKVKAGALKAKAAVDKTFHKKSWSNEGCVRKFSVKIESNQRRMWKGQKTENRLGFCTNPHVWVSGCQCYKENSQCYAGICARNRGNPNPNIKYLPLYRGEEFYPDFAEALPNCSPIFNELQEITPDRLVERYELNAEDKRVLIRNFGRRQYLGRPRKTRRVYEWMQINVELRQVLNYLRTVLMRKEEHLWCVSPSALKNREVQTRLKYACDGIEKGWSSLVRCGNGKAPCWKNENGQRLRVQPPRFKASNGDSLCDGNSNKFSKSIPKCNLRRMGVFPREIRKLTSVSTQFDRVKQCGDPLDVDFAAKTQKEMEEAYAEQTEHIYSEIDRISERIRHVRNIQIAGFDCQIRQEGDELGYLCQKWTGGPKPKLEVCKVVQAQMKWQQCAENMELPAFKKYTGTDVSDSEKSGIILSGKSVASSVVTDLPMAKQTVCQESNVAKKEMHCKVHKFSKCVGDVHKCNQASSTLLYF